MSTVIQISNLSKIYRLGEIGTGTISRDLERWYKMRIRGQEDPFLKIGETNERSKKGVSDVVYSLRDINLEVQQGEAFGIIGKNGAGKSTLLKIISRVTSPTTGKINIKGRVASLLEVGTGFHPELTGRENIYLNGAILGMRKNEITCKLDEIIDFSGVERYIDTPVKRYSSGMYVRLAFAVAAHLESEILIVDEVLAVGDIEFQKKCLGKMGEISKGEGRTVLFVSHNLAAVKKLCNKGILLEDGVIKTEGKVTEVIDHYTNCILSQKIFKAFKIKGIDLKVTKITLNEESGGLITPFKPLRIDIEMEADREITNIGIQIMISHEDTSGMVFATNTKTTDGIDVKIMKGKNTVTCTIESLNICSGKYWLGFGMDLPFTVMYYHELSLISFDVSEVLVAPRQLSTSSIYGHVYLDHQWSIKQNIK